VLLSVMQDLFSNSQKKKENNVTFTQAVTVAPAASAHAIHDIAIVPDAGLAWIYTSHSYPDTSTGRSQCVSMGIYYEDIGAAYTYQCRYDDPNPGRLNLWIDTYV
jgi:hypothetical protein